MPENILVIEYEPRYTDRVKQALAGQPVQPSFAHDGDEAIRALDNTNPKLIVVSSIVPKTKTRPHSRDPKTRASAADADSAYCVRLHRQSPQTGRRPPRRHRHPSKAVFRRRLPEQGASDVRPSGRAAYFRSDFRRRFRGDPRPSAKTHEFQRRHRQTR